MEIEWKKKEVLCTANSGKEYKTHLSSRIYSGNPKLGAVVFYLKNTEHVCYWPNESLQA